MTEKKGRTTGNFTTQADGQFPLDCETLAMLQDNASLQAIIGNMAGDKVVLRGCEQNSVGTERQEGYVFLRTKDYPEGEVIYWAGGSVTTGVMHLVKEVTQVQALGASYDAYTSRRLEAGKDEGEGAENFNWEEFAEVKNMRELMAEIEELTAEIENVHKETSEPLGIVKMWAGPADKVPGEYRLCEGQALSTADYKGLHDVIGDVFNTAKNKNGQNQEAPGDGMFRLPDLRGRFIVGRDTADDDYSTIGKTGGKKKHVLTIDEMPSHSHRFDGHDIEAYVGSNRNDSATRIVESNEDAAYATLATGGGKAHENRPPYYVLAYIMRVK